jgi:hypothetical protein
MRSYSRLHECQSLPVLSLTIVHGSLPPIRTDFEPPQQFSGARRIVLAPATDPVHTPQNKEDFP